MINKFNSILSLGSHCEPSDHYRRFFGEEPSSPFDWLITPLSSLLKILEDNGNSFGLKITPALDDTSVECLHYGCLYHHEFEKLPSGKIFITSDQIQNCRDKLTYKYEKMIRIAKNTAPIFVRWVHPTEKPSNQDLDDNIFSDNDLNALLNLLEKRIGHKNFCVAFIKTDENLHPIFSSKMAKNFNNIEVHSYRGLSPREEINHFFDLFYLSKGFKGISG